MNAQRMTVRYVYDGDTVQLQATKSGRYVTTTAKIKVRLIGVDAPEMTPTKECYAQQATDRLTELAPIGSQVWVAPDKDSWDDYRRRLFHVWSDQGQLLDYQLVAGGYGRALRIWPNVTYASAMEAAQRDAQKAERGLWGALLMPTCQPLWLLERPPRLTTRPLRCGATVRPAPSATRCRASCRRCAGGTPPSSG